VASSNPIFARLALVVGHPEWKDDPRFATNPARVRNLQELDAALAAWFVVRPFAEISDALEGAGVPFSKVYTIEDIEQDPQFAAREGIVRLADPLYGSLPAPCIVPRIAGRALPVPRTGPDVGEHNAAVYARFGLDAEALAALRAQDII
jgi:crotonobetainyl-CoA:carnitine CoA-transferase CaiB-like acyl-CoA transferase